jgi:thiamine pyridinylase
MGARLFGAVAAVLLCSAAPMPRVLHLSMYPYIPDAADAALTLKQGFEESHPGVLLRITLNENYYNATPGAGGVLEEDADIHEIDGIFLKDFLARHKLSAFSSGFARTIPELHKLARVAAMQGGMLVAVPHWLCSDFLFTRADQTALDRAHTLAALQAALPPGRGLLLDMAEPALGELILSYLLGRDGSAAAALKDLHAAPDPALVRTMRAVLALEPPGFGRSLADDGKAGFYARQFARGAGSGFIGYSEATHDILEEGETSCRAEDHCLTQAGVHVGPWPFSSAAPHQVVWVDMYGIDAHVHGALHRDAEDFIAYAMQEATYRALLIPPTGAPPRYLLPARADSYADTAILAAAPLYARFLPILDTGIVVEAPALNATLHQAAATVSAALPASH